MHPFWEVQDVVSEVILHLSKANKARVARVNKGLWELAVPHIWRFVPALRHFFNLFPSDLWIPVKRDSMVPPALERELQDSDWSRFLFYSKSTRSIDYSIGSLRNVVPPEVLSHPLLLTSFPSLERLSVGVVVLKEEGPIEVTPLLLRPSLRSVKFYNLGGCSSAPLVGPLRTISESSTISLEEMSFGLLWELDTSKGIEIQAIASQTGLRRLKISSLMGDITKMVETARSLPFLEELEVGTSKVYSPFSKQDPTIGFPALRTLVVAGVPAEVHNLLRSTGSSSLARVALTLFRGGGGGIYPGLVAEMQRFKSHLVNLELDMNVPFTWEDLEPALALVELQAFGLENLGRSSHPITDAQLRQMIDSWPHLTQLRLVSESTATLRVTLSSLAYIASNCPNLRRLAITFEGRQAMNPEFSDKVDASNFLENGLELFDVVGSAFDRGDEGRLAEKVFRLWWPKAQFCESSPRVKPGLNWEIDDVPSWP